MSFAKILSGTQLECQTFWMQTRNDFHLVLILVLTVCKVISRQHCLSDKMLYTVTRVFLHISVQWHRSLCYNIKCKLYLKFKYNTIEPERSFFYKLFVVCWLFFKITFFNKFFQKHTIRVSVGLDQDKDQHSSRIWVLTVCKGYQQMTKVFVNRTEHIFIDIKLRPLIDSVRA